jgi:hypothetical protein
LEGSLLKNTGYIGLSGCFLLNLRLLLLLTS